MASDAQIAAKLGQLDTWLRAGHVKANKDDIDAALDELAALAEEHGLNQGSLCKGYELALGGVLPTAQALKLLPELVPREPLPVQPVLLTLSALGDASHNLPLGAGKVDYKVQRRALEQLVVLLELGAISEQARSTLDRLYGVVERGLQYRTLRDATAAILCQVTRRHHVKPYRIDELNRIIARDPAPPSSLLRLREEYRSYEPERVYEQRSTGSSRAGRSKALEAWKESASTIFEGGGAKVPDSNGERELSRTTTPLSDLSTVTALASHIDTSSMPSQAASVLSTVSGSTRRARPPPEADRARAWGLLLRSGYQPNSEHLARLSAWLISQLQYELYDLEPSDAGRARIEDLFCRVRELCELGGELLEALEPFLADFLHTWDGEHHRKVVFDIVALLKPFSWEQYAGFFLDKLRKLADSHDVEWSADFVACLTALVRNLAVRDNWDPETPTVTAFGMLDGNVQYLDALQGILAFGDAFILSATCRFPTSLVLRTAALTFYERLLDLPLALDLPLVVLPSPAFTYTCLLSNELMSLSRICGIVARLRDALVGEASAIVSSGSGAAPEHVEALNARVVEIVGVLWQKRFLRAKEGADETDAGVMGLSKHDVDELNARNAESRTESSANSQGITTHGALALLARDCLAVLAEHQGKSSEALVGPVTVSSLKALSAATQHPSAPNLSFNAFRPHLVEYLAQRGATGLSEFLFSSLQSLVQRRASMTA
ncbi:hypothetical protein Rhopal_007794-T1 [Rhodotorula paludigena]|uniref:Uncharacterized protein n=1 Tax=Rhodotorula paludigena TaxID=86838 RepID=A0AAV5H1V8_9BASI|nr:hypothetical protein Rhopal_007794-T1 [Rhodotorula paludigena]